MSEVVKINRRLLGVQEYGSKEGFPVFYCHAFPGSRLDGVSLNFDVQAKDAGCRIIAVDRPGIGLSDHQQDRSLSNYADDIVGVADHLGIDRFSVAGFSGGGPYALSVAAKIPDRVISVAFISGMGPKDFTECRKDNAMLIPRQPIVIRRLVAAFLHKTINTRPATLSALMKIFLPAPDVQFMSSRSLQLFFIENFKQGGGGFLKDADIYRQPWGLKLSDIRPRVAVWHGSEDRNVSRASAQRIVRELPDASANFLTGEGHFSLIGKHFSAILTQLHQKDLALR
jgi:pimeloyl-ACP methyl ester carboxylesterase